VRRLVPPVVRPPRAGEAMSDYDELYHIASPSGIQGRPARLNELLPEPLEHVQEREERQRAKVRAALERLR